MRTIPRSAASLRRTSLVFTSLTLGLLLVACGDSTEKRETRTSVVSAKPKGSVTGLVTDGGEAPLEGVEVVLHLGSETRRAETNASGRYAFSGVPAGSSVGIEMRAEGHSGAWQTATLPAAAGEYPQSGTSVEVKPTALWALDNEFRFRVVAEDGEPIVATGARCTFDASWSEWVDGAEWSRGGLSVMAEVGPGEISCSQVPSTIELLRFDVEVYLVIPALDLDGDGVADLEGINRRLSYAEISAGSSIISLVDVLEGNDDAPELIATNAPSLDDSWEIRDSVLRQDEALVLVFDQPIVVHRSTLEDEQGKELIAHEVEADGYTIRITPEGGSWPAGQEVNAELLVARRDLPTKTQLLSGPFLVASDEELELISLVFVDDNDNGRLDPGETLRVEFSQVLGYALYDPDPIELELFVEADLDGSGVIGDARGEWGGRDGLAIDGDEPSFPGSVDSGFTRYATMTWSEDPVEEGTRLWVRSWLDDPLRLPDGRLFLDAISGSLTAVSE